MDENERKLRASAPLAQLQFITDHRELLNILNGSYIAKRFFGRSGSWFSQKLNNHMKNGQPCQFSKEELKTLANALYTISYELQDLADDIK